MKAVASPKYTYQVQQQGDRVRPNRFHFRYALKLLLEKSQQLVKSEFLVPEAAVYIVLDKKNL